MNVKQLMHVCAAWAMALLLTSCAATGLDASCSWVKPIFIGQGDQFTPQTAGQVLSHNIAWMHFCNKDTPPGVPQNQ